MFSFLKKHWTLLFIIVFLLVFVLISVYVPSKQIVDYIGVQNTYLASFLLAVFGGLSTVTGISFFASVVTFSGGGASPFLLGLFGGLGIFISDTIFFFVARYGVQVFRGEIQPTSLWVASRIERISPYLVLIGVYFYIGFTPFPNDILMIALAFLGVPFKRLAPVLLAGSITIVILTAYIGEIVFR